MIKAQERTSKSLATPARVAVPAAATLRFARRGAAVLLDAEGRRPATHLPPGAKLRIEFDVFRGLDRMDEERMRHAADAHVDVVYAFDDDWGNRQVVRLDPTHDARPLVRAFDVTVPRWARRFGIVFRVTVGDDADDENTREVRDPVDSALSHDFAVGRVAAPSLQEAS